MYKIPLFDLNFNKAEEIAVIRTLRSKWISTGPKCEELEKKFGKMLNIKYAVSLSNCTSALHMSLLLLGIKENDEVICPSLTFVATVNCIRYINAKPVFCDIKNLEYPVIDEKDIERKITKKTKAIIVMHYAGFPCNMNVIMKIARKNNLKVIEDACHGPLSEYNGVKLGTIGDVGCFSFFSNKNISTGEGGILVTNNYDLYEKAKLLRSHGMTSMSFNRASGHSTHYNVIELGYNYRMDDIRASIAIAQLKKLKRDYQKREAVRKYYIEKLQHIENIIIPFKKSKGYHSNYIFPIVLNISTTNKRDLNRKILSEAGIQTSVHYPAVHRFEIYKNYSVGLPKTEYYTDNSITLPMYASLSKKSLDYICKTIENICIR